MAKGFGNSIFQKIPPGVWAIGFVTMLMNGSTIIIFVLHPLYLKSVLGISFVYLGLLEGGVEAASWFTRIFSGVLSDYIHKRKPLLIAAYGLAAFSRLIFPFSPGVGVVFAARFIDRIGNGMQATPREALIGDLAPAELKGACYGLRQTLGTIGSFAGALLLVCLLRWKGVDYTTAFWVAVIPPIVALVILMFFVRDLIELKPRKRSLKKVFHLQDIKNLPSRYWRILLVASVFMLSNYSGAFMILQSKSAGLADFEVPIVMVIQNIMAFLVAFPVGWLSDLIGRRMLLGIGFAVVVLSNLLLAETQNIIAVLIGVGLWGVQMGMNQSLLVAKIADTAPEELRGSAFGIYYFVIGIMVFFTNYIAGKLSDLYSPESVFYASAMTALVAILCLVLFIPPNRKK